MQRRDLACAAGAALVATGVYVRTLAPGLVAEPDVAMFQFVGRVLGVPHNPGYPLYVLITHVVSYVPFGPLPYRINLFSAIMGGAAVAVVYLAGRALGCGRWPSAFAALGLAFGQLFWSQAVIAEVYTMHAALVAGALCGFLEWGRTRDPRWFYTGVASLAAGLSHHTTIVAFIPAAVLFALITDRAFACRMRTLVTSLAILATGLIPYLFVVVRSNSPGAYLESRAATIAQLPAVVFARQFQSWTFVFDAETVLTQRLPTLFRSVLVAELTWAGIGLAALGAAQLIARQRASACLLLVGAAATVGFAVNYRIVDIPVFFIPAILVLWLLAGVGLDGLLTRISAMKGAARLSAALGPLAALALVTWLLTNHFTLNDRSGDTSFATVLDRLGEAIPAGSAVVREDFLVDRLMAFKRLTDTDVGAKALQVTARAGVGPLLQDGVPVFAFAGAGRQLRLDGFQVGFRPLQLPAVTFNQLLDAADRGALVAVAVPARLALQFRSDAQSGLRRIGAVMPGRSGASLTVVGIRGARSGTAMHAEGTTSAIDLNRGAPVGETGSAASATLALRADAESAAIQQGGRDLIRSDQGPVVGVWDRDGRLTHLVTLAAVERFTVALPARSLALFSVKASRQLEIGPGAWADVTPAASSGGTVVRLRARQTLTLVVEGAGHLEPRAIESRGAPKIAVTRLDASASAALRAQLDATGPPGTRRVEQKPLHRIEVTSAPASRGDVLLAFGGVPTRAVARLTADGGIASLHAVGYEGLLRTPDRTTELLTMSRDEQSQLVGHGWSGVEADAGGGYRWIEGSEAHLLMPVARAGTRRVRVQAIAAAGVGAATLSLSWNGKRLPPRPQRTEWQTYEWSLPSSMAPGLVDLAFHVDNGGRGRAVAIGDVRLLIE